MSTMITRFPPSPTGYLHIGGARTALFNYLLARHHGGRFVLRIEDTDKARSTQEMTDAILEGMSWLGLEFDEGPFFQSERTEIYNEHIDKLLESGQAYYCDRTPEQIEVMRAEARAKGSKRLYDGHCRDLGLGPGPGRVVRFKVPRPGKIVFQDMVKGSVAIDAEEIEDFVIRRADGSPIYQMAVVVDDATMGITHVLRGDDHLSNTPKQIMLFEALGFPVPVFGHVPMILGPDKKKMSKRHGAVSVMVYKEMGYLPEAMLNYLARLGWSHGDEEIFTREELIEKFSIENLGNSPSVFDQEKLNWLNSHYIKTGSLERLAPLLAEYLEPMGFTNLDPDYLKTIIPLLQPRAKTMVEMAEQTEFFVTPCEDLAYDPKAAAKFLTEEARGHLTALLSRFEAASSFAPETLEAIAKGYLEETGLKFKAIAQPIRVALSGRTVSPGLFETMEVLGRERSFARIRRAIAFEG
jgi:glutamyl-tRNA synthetase